MKIQKTLLVLTLILCSLSAAFAQTDDLKYESPAKKWARENYKKVIDDINDCISRPNCTVKIESVVNNLTLILEAYPEYTDALWTRANYYSTLGQKAAALEDMSAYIELKDDPTWYIFYSRAELYEQVKQYYPGISDYTKALEGLEEDTSRDTLKVKAYYMNRILNSRGWLYVHTGKYEDAVLDFTGAIEIDGSSASSYEGRMQAYEKLKRKDLAKADKKMWKRLRGY